MTLANASGPATTPRARAEVRRLAIAAANQVPGALLLLAEGFWIAILYVFLQVARSEPLTLGPLVFALAAGAGSVAVRRAGGLGERWPLAATVLVGLAAVIGWLLSPGVREALVSPHPGAALSTHPGGWLMGLAFLRGVSVGGSREEAPSESLVMAGVPIIAAAYAFAGAIGGARLAAFAAAAVPDTVLFVATGLVGMALVRIRWLAAVSSVRWSANRAWLALLLVIVAGMLVVAVPVSFTVAPLVMLIVALLPVPLFVAGLLLGIDRRLVQTLAVVGVFVLIALLLVQAVLNNRLRFGQSIGSATSAQSTTPDNSWFAVVGWLFLVAVVALSIAVIVLLWMRRAPVRYEDAGEERTIDRGPERERNIGQRLARRPRHVGAPRDAVEAYLAALRLLAAYHDLRRDAGETPAEHVRRVRWMDARQRVSLQPGEHPGEHRSSGPPSIARPLGLLAADFELFQFAGRQLSPAEHRRGLERWESIKAAVHKRPRNGRLL